MSKILAKLKEFFTVRPQGRLEAFLESKNVKSTAEVEYWARYYDQHKGNVWGGGILK
jgi:hypothetical protein